MECLGKITNQLLYIDMAKGSADGLWRGKKGSSVFYRIKNSNNAQKQGIRERVYEVSNPKSAAQASQRMKMYPIQRLASALSDVITRGFETYDYGPKSRYRFLSLALSQKRGIPAVAKDDTITYPAKVFISEGSLPTIHCSFFNDRIGPLIINLKANVISSNPTLGNLSTALILGNSFLHTGDQLTFVLCLANSLLPMDGQYFSWKVVSFKLSATDNTPVASLFGPNASFEFGNQITIEPHTEEVWVAAAVILSREGSDGKHLRSSQNLIVVNDLDFLFGDPERYENCRKSYMKSSLVNSDWPVIPTPIPQPQSIQLVDLGLPSGTLWADRNLGAYNVFNFGKYFQWGNVDGVSEGDTFNFNAQQYAETSGGALTTDIIQGSDNDAAHVLLGDAWVIPTADQMRELINPDYTDKLYIEDYQRSGVNGWLLTSKIEGYTDRSIFLPMTGKVNLDSFIELNRYGNYWTSNINNNEYSPNLYMTPSSLNVYTSQRYSGFSIRPVQNG